VWPTTHEGAPGPSHLGTGDTTEVNKCLIAKTLIDPEFRTSHPRFGNNLGVIDGLAVIRPEFQTAKLGTIWEGLIREPINSLSWQVASVGSESTRHESCHGRDPKWVRMKRETR
jgi:hypothetical protein